MFNNKFLLDEMIEMRWFPSLNKIKNKNLWTWRLRNNFKKCIVKNMYCHIVWLKLVSWLCLIYSAHHIALNAHSLSGMVFTVTLTFFLFIFLVGNSKWISVEQVSKLLLSYINTLNDSSQPPLWQRMSHI